MKNKKSGFAILTIASVLSFAAIIYTANMASLQLIDNQVLANYYRNNEAFVNAESGVNLVLSKLNSVAIADEIVGHLPFTYPAQMNASIPYQVTVSKVAINQLQITSLGSSQDGSAKRQVSMLVYYSIAFNIPLAPISTNGKLSIDSSATINDGCEGVNATECHSPGNTSEHLIISQPTAELEITDLCSGDALQQDNVDERAIYGELVDENGQSRLTQITNNQWGEATSSAGSIFDRVNEIEDMNNAGSLFEVTFGVTREDAVNELSSSGEVARIDMTAFNAVSCSEQLKNVAESISVIYIKGDCNIDQNDTSHSATSENKRFTIGSPEHPKMVFIEGGTFITKPNTGSSVVGMLYFLPGLEDVLDDNGEVVYIDDIKQVRDQQSVDMGGIRVNGALLSEYNCSADGDDKTDKKGTKQHFSVRYDKTVLNQLYSEMGMLSAASTYQLVAGSWRDF